MENNNLVDIGKRIKEQRKKNNLTQEELGAQLLVSREKVNYWETGSRDIKTGDLVALAKALNTTSDYLLGIERGTTPETSTLMDAIGLSETSIKYLSNENNAKARELFDFLINDEIMTEQKNIKAEEEYFRIVEKGTESQEKLDEMFLDFHNRYSILTTLCKILAIANTPNDIYLGLFFGGNIELTNILRKGTDGIVVDAKSVQLEGFKSPVDYIHDLNLSDYLSDRYIANLGEMLKAYHRECRKIENLS